MESRQAPSEEQEMKKHPVPLYVAEAIASKRRLICIGGHFHEYDGGVYRRREHWVLERDAIAHIRKEARRSILGDIIKVLEVQTSVAPESIYQSGRIINLQNGLLELGKRVTLTRSQISLHDPDPHRFRSRGFVRYLGEMPGRLVPRRVRRYRASARMVRILLGSRREPTQSRDSDRRWSQRQIGSLSCPEGAGGTRKRQCRIIERS